MNKIVTTITTAALLMCSFAPNLAMAESTDYIYGTMQIPYADFYAAEGVSISVDTVSSATDSKWQNTGLTGGTYNEPHTDDAGGDIPGVTYYVAITQSDLDSLGDANYSFTASEETPAAYKTVTVADGKASFSAVNGETTALEATAALSTESRYGDYQLSVDAINNSDGTSDIGTIYGVLINTEEGGVYAMRHLENIWRDELSWSAGYTTTEVHGNTLSTENYADMMGQTISQVVYITDSGYHTLAADIYVPVKFGGTAEVADAAVSAGNTSITVTSLPDDYSAAYSVEGLEAAVADGTVTYSDAMPGSYTLTVSDTNGIYADMLADFVLSTDDMPVAFDSGTGVLGAAEGFDADYAANFIANLASVTIGETTYTASGHGAVAIITADGTIDTEAAVVNGRGAEAVSTPVFAENGDYELTVTATGYTQPITFTVTIAR